jgi:hypothetical protein
MLGTTGHWYTGPRAGRDDVLSITTQWPSVISVSLARARVHDRRYTAVPWALMRSRRGPLVGKVGRYCKRINFRGVLFFAVFYENKNPRKLVPRK